MSGKQRNPPRRVECDFTIFAHPVLAVACPACEKRAGSMCIRPSGHRAADFHRARKAEADRLFIVQHGEAASIERTTSGWHINPHGYRPEPTPPNRRERPDDGQLSLF